MRRTRRVGVTIAAGIAVMVVAACDNRNVEAAASGAVQSAVSSSRGGEVDSRGGDARAPAPRGDKTAVATDDASMTAKVKAAIFAEPGFDDAGIHVAVQDGTVTLSGQVDSAAKRERAAQIATQVTGVKNVVDQMEVRG